MLILLTNDDGIRAPGIVAMYKALAPLGEVRVVAPETVQSATGHGITLSTPLMTQTVEVDGVFTGVAVDGRPADCVKLAVSQILPRPPDLVVSGMNSGANVGINVIYSGTVAAAIEAGFLGLPAVATSLWLRSGIPADYDPACVWATEAIRKLLARGIKGGEIVSINVPSMPARQKPKGYKVVRQCTRPWVDTYEKRTSPKGQDYFWNSSVFTLGETDPDTDVAALREEYVTITPLQFDLTDHAKLRAMQGNFWDR